MEHMDSGFEQNKFEIYSRDIISYRDCSEKKILDSFGKFFFNRLHKKMFS